MTPADSHAPKPRVVVAIASFGRPDLTIAIGRSLLRTMDPNLAHLLVVDDGSPELQFRELVAGLDNRIRLVRLPSNRGYGSACNAAATIACQEGADAVWFLNNDVEIPSDALTSLLEELDRAQDVAAVAPATIDWTGSTVLGAGVDYGRWRGRVRHRWLGRSVTALPAVAHDVPLLEAACLLVSINALREVGGFDLAFRMYWEDTDWCLRAAAAGYRFRIVPSVHVQHMVGQSLSSRARIAYLIGNRIRIVRRHGSAAEQIVFLGFMLVGWLPAYYAARLLPEFGLRGATAIVCRALASQIVDAARKRRWRLRAADQEIEAICSGSPSPGSAPLTAIAASSQKSA